MLHSRLCFLSSRLDECTGNGEPGAIGCSASAGRLRLGSLGLKSDALGSPSALWARDRDNQLFRGSGNDGFGPTRLAKPSIALTLGTAATLRSTALARDDGSWKRLTDR